jgi:hypothetical protein
LTTRKAVDSTARTRLTKPILQLLQGSNSMVSLVKFG